MESALLKATAIFPTKRTLAKQIGVAPERINSWLNNNIEIPVQYAFQIQRATKFQVKWYELISKETRERMEHANTPLEKEMGYFIELSDMLINNVKDDVYATLTNNENFSTNLERPICIDENNTLIFGKKRLVSYKKQQKKKISVRRLSLAYLLEGCYCQAIINQVFNLAERTIIGIRLEQYIGNRQGQRTDLFKNKRKDSPRQEPRLNLDEVKGRTDQFIAKLLGLSSKIQYRQLKKIIQYGSPQLIEQINNEAISISKGASLAKLSHQEQITKLNQ